MTLQFETGLIYRTHELLEISANILANSARTDNGQNGPEKINLLMFFKGPLFALFIGITASIICFLLENVNRSISYFFITKIYSYLLLNQINQ